MNLLITGGYGFIGSNLAKLLVNKKEVKSLTIIDKHSYAANPKNINSIHNHEKLHVEEYCLSDYELTKQTIDNRKISHIIHLAAETHVDNSIDSSKEFITSNINGTHSLLEAVRGSDIRFHHVSTDEVYGQVLNGEKFTEKTPYAPRNPYSASKAASDMMVRAYVNTYGIKATLSNCSNNYGPHQHSEKLIPTIINSLAKGKKIPVYGDGKQVRDWIYVKDHCKALWKILKKGAIGKTYLVGADCEKTNLETIKSICKLMNKDPRSSIEFVEDRLGHDFRYAIDSSTTEKELDWKPETSFEKGLYCTLEFYYNQGKQKSYA